MDSKTMTRQYKLHKQTEIIRECRSSGLSVAKWCKENSVTPSNYYYWLKRVRQAACDTLLSVSQNACSIVPATLQNQVTVGGKEYENNGSNI